MRILPDALTSELAFYAGTADGYAAQAHQVARLQNDPRFHVNSLLGLGYSYIGYNLRRPLFQDVRVRTALGMAIDVDEVIRYVLYRQGRRTTGPYPPADRVLRPRRQAPALRSGRGGPAPLRGRVAQERAGDPGEGRQASRVHPHHELRQRGAPGDHGHRPERLAPARGEGRDPRARVGGLHPGAREQARLRRGRPRLGDGARRGHLPDLPLEPGRAAAAELRRLREPAGGRADGAHSAGVRRRPPDGHGPRAPPAHRPRTSRTRSCTCVRRCRSWTGRSFAWCAARTVPPSTCRSSRTVWAASTSTSTSGSRRRGRFCPPSGPS